MLDWPALIIIATLLVGYANGANDNFKGVATLFGADALDLSAGIYSLLRSF